MRSCALNLLRKREECLLKRSKDIKDQFLGSKGFIVTGEQQKNFKKGKTPYSLKYEIDDLEYAKKIGTFFPNEQIGLLKPNKTYAFVITEDGQFTLGLIENAWEFGVKHLNLAQGNTVYAAGELYVGKDGNLSFNLVSGTFMRPMLDVTEDTKNFKKEEKIANKVLSILRNEQKCFEANKKIEFIEDDLGRKDQPSIKEISKLCSEDHFKKNNTEICIHIFNPELAKLVDGIPIQKVKNTQKDEKSTNNRSFASHHLNEIKDRVKAKNIESIKKANSDVSPLGGSLNLVVKLEPPFLLDSSWIAELPNPPTREELKANFLKYYRAALTQKEKNKANSETASQYDSLVSFYQILGGKLNEYNGEMGGFIKLIKKELINKLDKPYATESLKLILKYLQKYEFFKKLRETPPNSYYRTDDLLHNLELLQKSNENPISLKKNLALLRGKGIHSISEHELKKLSDDSGVSVASVLRNVHRHYLSSDIGMGLEDGSEKVGYLREVFKSKLRNNYAPSYAFKTGVENQRELLARDVTRVLGFDSYLTPKIESTLNSVVIKSDKESDVNNSSSTKGISSEWIKGKDIDRATWEKYLEAKQKMEMVQFEIDNSTGQNDLKISNLKNDLKNIEKMVRNYEWILKGQFSRDSGQTLAFLDTLFGSFDSHILQYKIENGSLKNIDFSRILAPSDTVINSKKEELYIPQRNILLDHPYSMEKMSDQLVKKIKEIDLEKVGIELQKHVGTKKEFKSAKKDLETIQAKLSGQLTMDENNELAKKRIAIQEKLYRKIEPHAYQAFLKRLELAKEYVKEAENPTIYGLYLKSYPQFGEFIKVLKRMEPNGAFFSLGLKMDDNKFQSIRSLRSIIQEAKDKKLATPSEIEAMEASMNTLKGSSSSILDLYTTMGINKDF
jgi:hypothetical protein